MEAPRPLPARPPVLFALTIGLLSLGAIWFTAAFLLPKAQQSLTHWSPHMPVPLGAAVVARAYWGIITAAYAAAPLIALLGLAALLSRLSAPVRRWCTWAVHGLALALFLGALYLAFLTFIALLYGHMGAVQKLSIYQRAFEVYRLTEIAEGHAERKNRIEGSTLGGTPRVVSSEDDLTRGQSYRHLQILREVLERTQDARAKRRVLATLPLLQKALQRNHGHDDIFLQHAQELSGQKFADMEAFLAWIPTAPVEDGWEPLPMFVIE